MSEEARNLEQAIKDYQDVKGARQRIYFQTFWSERQRLVAEGWPVKFARQQAHVTARFEAMAETMADVASVFTRLNQAAIDARIALNQFYNHYQTYLGDYNDEEE